MMTHERTSCSSLNSALEPLRVLVGEWKSELSFPHDHSETAHGHASFKWIENGAFLHMESDVDHPNTPHAIAVIGSDDDSTETYDMLYFDSRDVSRTYKLSLDDGVWRMWRDAPEFSQRFTGTISENGDTITARWEKSSDGSTWEHDFDLIYTRMTQTE